MSVLARTIEIAKVPIRPAYRTLRRCRWYRFARSSGFRSGRLAFGEKNSYSIAGNWVTVDIDDADYCLDLMTVDHLPWEDATQRFIYSSHLVEHLSEERLKWLLTECRRILAPGGVLRLETPDMELIVDAYRTSDAAFLDYFTRQNQALLVEERGMPSVFAERHVAMMGLLSCFVQEGLHVPVVASRDEVEERMANSSNADFAAWCVSLQTEEQARSGGHVNPMSYARLSDLLAGVGFEKVERVQNGQTEVPGLKLGGIERSGRAFYSFNVEAHK